MRFDRKTLPDKNPMGFDLKTGCSQGTYGLFFKNTRVLPSKMQRACVSEAKCMGEELSDQGFKANCMRNLSTTWLGKGH